MRSTLARRRSNSDALRPPHGVLDRAELAPRALEVAERAQLRFPVRRAVLGKGAVRWLRRQGIERVQQGLARTLVLRSRGLHRRLLRRHRFVGRLQGRVELLPLRCRHRRAQAARLLPAPAQGLNTRGMRLQVQPRRAAGRRVGGGHGGRGQFDGFGHQGIQGLRSTPLLPVAQSGTFDVQRPMARAQVLVKTRPMQTLQRHVDGVQVLLHGTELALGQCGLGLAEPCIELPNCSASAGPAIRRRRRCCDIDGGVDTVAVGCGQAAFFGTRRGLPRRREHGIQRRLQSLVEAQGRRAIRARLPQCIDGGRTAAGRVLVGIGGRALQLGHGLRRVGTPSAHPVLQFALRVHRGIDALAQPGE